MGGCFFLNYCDFELVRVKVLNKKLQLGVRVGIPGVVLLFVTFLSFFLQIFIFIVLFSYTVYLNKLSEGEIHHHCCYLIILILIYLFSLIIMHPKALLLARCGSWQYYEL
jgi:hypothetical protein